MNHPKRPCYCYYLRRAANMVASIYDCAMEETGLTAAQYLLLSNLDREEAVSVSELASFAVLDRTTVVRTMKPLMEKGYILDLADEGARDRKLVLSGEGWRIMRQGEKRWAQAQVCIEEKIGAEKAGELLTLLQQLTE